MSTSRKKTPPQPEAPVPDAEPAVEAQPAPDTAEGLLAAARAEAAQNHDNYLRARADLENFRKRAQRDKEEAIRYGNEELIREVLPVVDNLERALAHAGDGEAGAQGLREGVGMTLSLLLKALERFGVKPVGAVGQPFDPAFHQAMGQVESGEHAPNTVVQELQKGYLLNERLLRPALVMVARAPAAAPSSDNA